MTDHRLLVVGWGLFAVLCGVLPLQAQFSSPVTAEARSFSRQFIVQALPDQSPRALAPSIATNQNYIRLEPTLVAVSCERIKQALARALGPSGSWTGRIFITLYPPDSSEDEITLATDQYKDGWQYRLALPAVLERERYVRTIVQVLLLESANRTAKSRSAEIPLWLTEGLTQQLLSSSGVDLILSPPSTAANGIQLTSVQVSARRKNPLEQTHQRLGATGPLSFQQLSWPAPEELNGQQVQHYRDSAQLFVSALLELPGGGACLRSMLEQLPQYYNWQFAFLRGFQPHFQRPLDVEKWWALQSAHFTGRELTETWPPDESWQKLDEIIRSTVQIRVGTNELPLRAETSLQAIIREWDAARQRQALQLKLYELAELRLRSDTNCLPLIDDYRQVLETYLSQQQKGAGLGLFRKKKVPRPTTEGLLRELDALDARRMELKPAKPASLAVGEK